MLGMSYGRLINTDFLHVPHARLRVCLPGRRNLQVGVVWPHVYIGGKYKEKFGRYFLSCLRVLLCQFYNVIKVGGKS